MDTNENITVLHTRHADMVAKLAKPGINILSSMSPADAHALHMTVGICGEIGELLDAYDPVDPSSGYDIENIIEELGDYEFYVEGLRQGFGFVRDDDSLYESMSLELESSYRFLKPSGLVVAARASIAAANLLDTIKKVVIYEQDAPEDKIKDMVDEIESALHLLRKQSGITRESCLVANMHKLFIRYPNYEFTNDRAKERADKK